MDDFQTPSNQDPARQPASAPMVDRYQALVEGPAGVPNEVLLRKVRGGGFSWCTFLFGPLYWVYRKCYVEAAILVLLNMLTGFLPANPIWLVLSLITSIVLGFAFPFLYRWRADRLHARALKNGLSGEGAAILYVRTRGGASWQGVILLVVAALAISFFEVLASGMLVTTPTSTSAF